MARICQHVVPEGAEVCQFCGTSQTMIGKGYGCIWRDTMDARYGSVMPEPSLRPIACEDAGVILARLAELKAARDAVNAASAEEPVIVSDGCFC